MSNYPNKATKIDPFLLNFDSTEVRIAAEFLSNWLPFLSRGLCKSCTQTLSHGIRSLHTEGNSADSVQGSSGVNHCKEDHGNCSAHSTKENAYNNDDADTHSLGSWKDDFEVSSEPAVEVSTPSETRNFAMQISSPVLKKSWADMALEDELVAEEGNDESNGVDDVNGSLAKGSSGFEAKPKFALSRDERERIRFNSVERNKDFICLERIGGKIVNVLDGLELHKGVFSAAEQKRIVSYVEDLQQMGRDGQLKDRTYSAPRKWMKGKGRITLQFGCCYNYARDKNGNSPGILKNEIVDPLPQLFKTMVKRLIRWHVLPPSCVPDSCIVNIYEEGDCIPPHIDNHEFVRPFCTVSFLSECNILFGSNLDITGPGEFKGSYAISLPLGSVLVLKGNGADVAKHCVPAVPSKRISITFRRMDESKRPYDYVPEPDMQGLQPLPIEKGRSQRFDSSSGNRRFSKRVPSGGDDRMNKGRPHAPENSSPPIDRDDGSHKQRPHYSENPTPHHSSRSHDSGNSTTRHSGRPRQGSVTSVPRIKFGDFEN